MTRRVIFDLDVLRSFVAGMDLGSFAKAADRLGRSTSAVSAHLKRLEGLTGTPVLRKSGRGLVLTEAGETMLAYARRLIELNDEAAAAVRGVDLAGWVRLGVQEDFGETLLPEVLARFARAHPRVKVEARVTRNAELLEGVETARLDLALCWNAPGALPHRQTLAELPMQWIVAAGSPKTSATSRGDPVPLVVFEPPCLFRSAATAALDAAGLAWRVTFTSASLSGLWAATAAGLGVTIRTGLGLPATLAAVGQDGQLPALPALPLVLLQSEAELPPSAARLAVIMRTAVGHAVAGLRLDRVADVD